MCMLLCDFVCIGLLIQIVLGSVCSCFYFSWVFLVYFICLLSSFFLSVFLFLLLFNIFILIFIF